MMCGDGRGQEAASFQFTYTHKLSQDNNNAPERYYFVFFTQRLKITKLKIATALNGLFERLPTV